MREKVGERLFFLLLSLSISSWIVVVVAVIQLLLGQLVCINSDIFFHRFCCCYRLRRAFMSKCVCVCHLLKLDIFVLFRVIESIVWSHFTYFHFHGSLTNKIPKATLQTYVFYHDHVPFHFDTISNMACVSI